VLKASWLAAEEAVEAEWPWHEFLAEDRLYVGAGYAVLVPNENLLSATTFTQPTSLAGLWGSGA